MVEFITFTEGIPYRNEHNRTLIQKVFGISLITLERTKLLQMIKKLKKVKIVGLRNVII